MRKDIDMTFRAHPLTGDLVIKKGSSALEQSIRNLVLTNYYERGFNVEVGSNVRGSLFENIDPLTAKNMADNVKQVLKNFEPQCDLLDVVVSDSGQNDINIKIYYNENNNPNERVVSIDLKKVS